MTQINKPKMINKTSRRCNYYFTWLFIITTKQPLRNSLSFSSLKAEHLETEVVTFVQGVYTYGRNCIGGEREVQMKNKL